MTNVYLSCRNYVSGIRSSVAFAKGSRAPEEYLFWRKWTRVSPTFEYVLRLQRFMVHGSALFRLVMVGDERTWGRGRGTGTGTGTV